MSDRLLKRSKRGFYFGPISAVHWTPVLQGVTLTPRETDKACLHGGSIMAHEARKKANTKKTAVGAAKRPKSCRQPKKTKANEPHKAITANAEKLKEKSVPEVAATHIEHMAYGLGYRIPSAWWRHAG